MGCTNNALAISALYQHNYMRKGEGREDVTSAERLRFY